MPQIDKYRNETGATGMRFNEFASAEDQIKLWKLISDNTWAAMTQLQRQAQQQRAAQQRAKRFKSSSTKLKRMAGKPRANQAPANTAANSGLQTVSPYLLNPTKTPTA